MSAGEELLAFQLKAYGIKFEREHKFHPTRRWRFDFILPESRTAIEVEGAVWTQGRHTRGSGFVKDMEKFNSASELGWKVFKFTTQQVKNGEAVQKILKILGR